MSGVPTSETKQGASEDQAHSKESVRIAVTNSVFMEDSEKNRYIEFLLQQKEERDRTTDIMIAMSTRLNELLLDENAHLGDMMQKALRYLNKFWKQLQGSLKNNKKLSQIECVLPERATFWGYTSELAANVKSGLRSYGGLQLAAYRWNH